MENKKQRKRAVSITLSFALYLAGLAAPLAGLFLFIVNYIYDGPDVVTAIANLLVVISIPLLLVSSHFMDLNEKK